MSKRHMGKRMTMDQAPVEPGRGSGDAARRRHPVRQMGLNRRRFLQALSAAGAFTVLAACMGPGDPDALPTTAAGNTQPDEIPFNEKGYLFNQPVPHPVRVT